MTETSVSRWQRALLPSGLYERPNGRRSARDWAVDVTMFLLALALGAVAVIDVWDDRSGFENARDIAIGAAAALALWLRRSRPVELAVVLVIVSTFFPAAAGASVVAIFSAAIRAPRRALLPIAALSVTASAVYPLVNPPDDDFLAQFTLGVLSTALAIGWGLFVRVRRALVGSLRERAERLEAEQRRHVEQAREAERQRIAREMHDVLAHRLSLLSVHAGALEFRPDAPAAEVAQAAGVIRSTAVTALDELREVIGVLRDGAEESTQPPQPTLAQLPALIEESRAAGMHVDAEIDATGLDSLPDVLGRAAYRVVQEGLTNARKHAAGATVDVRVASPPGALVVEIVSRRPVGVTAGHRGGGAGVGLIGLRERLGLVGGELEHGPDASGDFVLRATLPRSA